jgi:murein DD-endopeptidase MepM/ murein hydrolase activator NlpD
VSGRLRVRNGDGAPSAPSTSAVTVAPGTAPPEGAAPRGSAPDRDTTDRLDARLETRTVYFAGFRSAVIRYVVTAPEPVLVSAEVRRVADGASVARWDLGTVAPGAEQRVGWDGTAGGTVAPDGRYEFRVFSPAAGASAADAAAPGDVAATFRFLDHKFPVRGPHDFGGATAVFGAQRQGHTHQGQDVFAPCGTPLVAARGGVVVFASFQGNAGNYVVVRGDGDGVDYAYMHLQQPSRAGRGARVRTGQRLGEVGDTGNAQGCHLHFEMWAPPGWYEGGRAIDPLAELRAWEAESGTVARPPAAAPAG